MVQGHVFAGAGYLTMFLRVVRPLSTRAEARLCQSRFDELRRFLHGDAVVPHSVKRNDVDGLGA